MALHVRYLLHKFGPRVLLLLPVRIKYDAHDVAVELQLLHAGPENVAGMPVLSVRELRADAAGAG